MHFTNFCIKWCMSVCLGAITKYETTTLASSQKNISNSNCEQCVAHWHWENVHHECSMNNCSFVHGQVFCVEASTATENVHEFMFNEHCSWIRILRRCIHSHSFHHDIVLSCHMIIATTTRVESHCVTTEPSTTCLDLVSPSRFGSVDHQILASYILQLFVYIK